jgi:hypothetical protein
MALAHHGYVQRTRERAGDEPAAINGPRPNVLDRVALQVTLDPYLSLAALARYGSLSVRKLRAHLNDVTHPLPCYRVGGKILVRRSEFDGWMAAFRQRGRRDVDRLVADVLREVQGRAGSPATSLDKVPAG